MTKRENYEFRILILCENVKGINAYDQFTFTTLQNKPIDLDGNNKIINLKVNKANNRGGIYYETAFLSSSKTNKKLKVLLTLNCQIDNIITIDLNEENGINLEIIEMWDIDYDEKYTEEREILNLVINNKEITNYEKLFERKRWNLINFNISSISSQDIFSSKTLDYLKNKKNINKNFLYNIILFEKEKIFLLKEKEESKIILFLTNEEKLIKKSIIKEINDKFNKITKSDNFKSNPFICSNDLKLLYKEYNNKLKELKHIFNCYSKYWDLDNFSEDDLNLFILYSDLVIFFSYSQFNSIHIYKNILEEYEKFKKSILSKNNLSHHEKARILCSYSNYCYNKISKINPEPPVFYMIEELPKDDPYQIACTKLYKIIENLKEYSCIFKKTLLFDNNSMEIINDWDFEKYDVKQLIMQKTVESGYEFKTTSFNEFTTIAKAKIFANEETQKISFPKLSMLTLAQVKEHLYNLVPKYFFKVKYTDFSAISDYRFFIMFINETTLLDIDNINENGLNKEQFVLPIMIEYMHENFNHLKSRYEDNNCESPLLNQIGLKNILLCPNAYKTESGYLFEQLLVDNPTELKSIKTPNESLFILTKESYWTQRSFKNFKEINKKFIKDNKIENFEISDEDYDFLCYDKRDTSGRELKHECLF